jgi:hypothetical protein
MSLEFPSNPNHREQCRSTHDRRPRKQHRHRALHDDTTILETSLLGVPTGVTETPSVLKLCCRM